MIRKKISTMMNRYYQILLAMLVVFMTVCLIPTASFAQDADKGEGTATEDGRKMDSEAHAALVEAQRRYETNPDDLAAARQPLIAYLAAPPEDALTPETLYMMLGTFWYTDDKNEKHIEEANKVFKVGHEAFPEDESFLFNYAVTTHDLERFGESAPLFEKYYALMAEKDIKFLEIAAQTYYMIENFKDAKRLYLKLIGMTETPKDAWLLQTIGICQAMEDPKEEKKYIRLALDYFPMEKKYWRYLANRLLAEDQFKAGAAALEIATRVEAPEDGSEWRGLIELYNYIGLFLRTAENTKAGLDLLAKTKDSSEEKQQLVVAEAYARGTRVDKAVAYLDSVIAKNPSYDLKIKKATILYDARRNEEALAALDDCIAADSRAYDAYYMKGWIHWDMKNWDAAEEAFEKSSSSKDDIIRYNSSDALEMLADLVKARTE
jgi:Tfp pilus assembly protein PilF